MPSRIIRFWFQLLRVTRLCRSILQCLGRFVDQCCWPGMQLSVGSRCHCASTGLVSRQAIDKRALM